MNQMKQEIKEIDEMVFRSLSSIYTGEFLIDLEKDRYKIIHSPERVCLLLGKIASAQQAIHRAVQNTVAEEDRADMFSFVDLCTLPGRMVSKSLNIEYKGTISGWVRGSFIEAERSSDGTLMKVLYVYQVIDGEKRKELNHLEQMKKDYAQTEKDNKEEKQALEKEKVTLTDKNILLTNENVELQRARDAVYAILNSGSYLCNYAEDGETLLSIKYSDALRKLYGYTDEQDAPDTWNLWIKSAHPDDREYVLNNYLAALRDHTGNTNYAVTYRAVKKDGTIRWHKAAGYVTRRKDGTAEFCYGFIMDIDEQKKAADMVDEALKKAELANKAKTSFLARMSHDIRTPMNGIIGLIDINEKHADDLAFTAENRRKAKIAANHLLSLLNDILQLSKLENSNIELSETPFDMRDLLDDIYTITEMRAKENGMTIRYEIDDNVRKYPYLWGSPLHIRQIYINLLGNSIKYNKQNGSILCSVSAVKTDETHVLSRVTIKDTGIGMNEEFLQHLFEPFAREHEEMTGQHEGTGLGLSIVKQLVEKMGGTIKVESTVDVGSSFYVEIPFRLAEEADMQETEVDESVGDITGKNILLVEDNELNMEIAEVILTDAGAYVTKAVNGRQAVEVFRQNSPGTFDIILMDVMMPIMNGYEATRCIRAMERSDAKTIPIIAMTANAFVEDVERARQAGMNAHLAKPLDVQEMLNVMAKYMS